MRRIALGVLALTAVLLITALSLSAGCSSEDLVVFHIQVIPEQLNGDAIAGQQCVFLVTVVHEGEGGSEKAVSLSATAPGSTVAVNPQAIVPGQVAEVTVIPGQASIGNNIEVTVLGERGELTDEKVITFDVVEGEDDRGPYATELRDKFVAWLTTNHPELGITNETEWSGTMVSPRWLVVSHYLFFSEDWEMHVSWHIMVPPYDWARIDLRHRFDEETPSYAFEISSVDADSEPCPIDPPESVWR
jgi:hypothetical protein